MIEKFSPSLLNESDYMGALQKEFSLVLEINHCCLKNYELSLVLYKEMLLPLSNGTIIDSDSLRENEKSTWIFRGVKLEHIIVHNLTLIIKATEKR
jgi:hypothetical protein